MLVTGASRGIGAAIAERFSECVPGVRLVLVGRAQERLDAVAGRCVERGAAEVSTIVVDLTSPEAAMRSSDEVESTFGGVDVLVNNAGCWQGGAAHEMPVGDFLQVLHDNLVSAFSVTRAFLPGMLERKRGDIFFMSSTSGLEGLPDNAAYCAAKHGVAGLAKAVRAETRGRGIRVCCVFPGPTETPTWEGSGVDATQLMAAADVAQTVVDAHRLSPRSMVEEIVLRPSGVALRGAAQ